MEYSIIIPTLNEEKLLPALLKQLNDPALRELFDYEIIISDGGSSDNTIKFALDSADMIKVHTNGTKQNIAAGRNIGAKLASGEILIFLNSDILLDNPKEFFSFLNDHFKNSNYLAMTCNVKIFPEEEIRSDYWFHTLMNKYFYLLNRLGMGMGRGECQVIRKEIFNKVEGNNEKLAAGEDFDLFRRIRKLGKILFATNISVYESPRRYRKYGYMYVTLSWFKNSSSIVLKNKSISKIWEQVR